MFPHLLSRLASGSSKVSSHDDRMERVSLSEINCLLEVLADVFPNHEVALLRGLLLDASQESRLHIAANALIQDTQRYSHNLIKRKPGCVEDWEKFRSTEYKETVEKLLTSEYEGLAKSTIRNVLLEKNHDYIRSHDALLDIASKSWRFNLATWILRRKAPPPRPPLDVARKSTGCARLDDEIYALGRPERDAQSSRDEQFAKTVNEDQYARAHALLECECCFGDYTWEDMTVCTEGHFFCRGCLDRSVKEALYGQGSCLFRDKCSVRCISSIAAPACEGFVASLLLQQALPAETLDRLGQRFFRDQLQSSGLPLVHCPACFYAAVDDCASTRLRPWVTFVLSFIRLCMQLPLYILTASIHLSVFLLLCQSLAYLPLDGVQPVLKAVRSWTSDAIMRARRRNKGMRMIFKCENPRCGLASCIDCGKEWAAFHNCRRVAAPDSRRLYVEQAMSEAVKRTCPQCRTSFVKSDGCNKLTCPCGYEMCYICRADVRGAHYGHFCQHFRVRPGTACKECDKCNLYEREDEQAVAAAAARRATEEWAAARNVNTGMQHVQGVVSIESFVKPHHIWLLWLEGLAEHVMELVLEF